MVTFIPSYRLIPESSPSLAQSYKASKRAKSYQLCELQSRALKQPDWEGAIQIHELLPRILGLPPPYARRGKREENLQKAMQTYSKREEVLRLSSTCASAFLRALPERQNLTNETNFSHKKPQLRLSEAHLENTLHRWPVRTQKSSSLIEPSNTFPHPPLLQLYRSCLHFTGREGNPPRHTHPPNPSPAHRQSTLKRYFVHGEQPSRNETRLPPQTDAPQDLFNASPSAADKSPEKGLTSADGDGEYAVPATGAGEVALPPARPGKQRQWKGGSGRAPPLPTTHQKSLAQAKLFDHKRREAARS